MKSLCDLEEVSKLITRGENLLLAADESLLKGLPTGNWIGGSIPYFMTEEGGLLTKEKILVTILPREFKLKSIRTYSSSQLDTIPDDYPNNGASFIIIPALTECHKHFANDVTSMSKIFDSPLVGWVSGVELSEVGHVKPIVINGLTGNMSTREAVVMHCELPSRLYAKIDIVNLFTQENGFDIEFKEEGFVIENAIINGVETNFSSYLLESNIDLKSPLVANYSGAMVNVSFQKIDNKMQRVHLYAPVFKGVSYKLASPLHDYKDQFNKQMNKRNITPVFSCNCILNYLYAVLEGEKANNLVGPVTFGEIAYILLNQTLVYVTIQDSSSY